jgi:hypothetical protein
MLLLTMCQDAAEKPQGSGDFALRYRWRFAVEILLNWGAAVLRPYEELRIDRTARNGCPT